MHLLQMIARMRQPLGISKINLAKEYEVTERTIERYLELLREVGFEWEKNEAGRFVLPDHLQLPFRSEEHVAFSFAEAQTIRTALLNEPAQNKLRDEILQKLYAVSEISLLADELQHSNLHRNVAALRNALQNKHQAILNGYQSANSETIENRLIEPVQFSNHYRYLHAFDVKKQAMRQFKMERVGSVTQFNKRWKHQEKHHLPLKDAFNMSGKKEYAIEMTLTLRARTLLEEEFPRTVPLIEEREANTYHYKDTVYSLEGVGRFVSGLPGEITLPENSLLLPFLEEKWKKFWQRHYLSE